MPAPDARTRSSTGTGVATAGARTKLAPEAASISPAATSTTTAALQAALATLPANLPQLPAAVDDLLQSVSGSGLSLLGKVQSLEDVLRAVKHAVLAQTVTPTTDTAAPRGKRMSDAELDALAQTVAATATTGSAIGHPPASAPVRASADVMPPARPTTIPAAPAQARSSRRTAGPNARSLAESRARLDAQLAELGLFPDDLDADDSGMAASALLSPPTAPGTESDVDLPGNRGDGVDVRLHRMTRTLESLIEDARSVLSSPAADEPPRRPVRNRVPTPTAGLPDAMDDEDLDLLDRYSSLSYRSSPHLRTHRDSAATIRGRPTVPSPASPPDGYYRASADDARPRSVLSMTSLPGQYPGARRRPVSPVYPLRGSAGSFIDGDDGDQLLDARSDDSITPSESPSGYFRYYQQQLSAAQQQQQMRDWQPTPPPQPPQPPQPQPQYYPAPSPVPAPAPFPRAATSTLSYRPVPSHLSARPATPIAVQDVPMLMDDGGDMQFPRRMMDQAADLVAAAQARYPDARDWLLRNWAGAAAGFAPAAEPSVMSRRDAASVMHHSVVDPVALLEPVPDYHEQQAAEAEAAEAAAAVPARRPWVGPRRLLMLIVLAYLVLDTTVFLWLAFVAATAILGIKGLWRWVAELSEDIVEVMVVDSHGSAHAQDDGAEIAKRSNKSRRSRTVRRHRTVRRVGDGDEQDEGMAESASGKPRRRKRVERVSRDTA
ncbi:hypothetical protein AMAG_10025 [Allomyces macrogynus ATCC 38327]|uniref:Uncharacterized protein n=1 Tax=Allomyces macrogynus (strain ATCC 38327) TaxID=578462 RepID=A0A0L0SQ79_ALLM3|nr:hypothetical protein AMAG_10025 [Allomyces macrogynus ATCC 38327]|eukprot:KNE64671.1 hypothetical protein AMAG_10025 [Allomyces macrogynus ATCC 38327]